MRATTTRSVLSAVAALAALVVGATPAPAASPGVTQVSVGYASACALQDVGALWCWGLNANGEVGNSAERGPRNTFPGQPVPARVPGSWAAVSMATSPSATHTCAVGRDTTLWCWGDNGAGQLGFGSTTVGKTSRPRQVAGEWADVVTAEGSTCGIAVDRTGWCWGNTGLGSTPSSAVPVVLDGSWESLSVAGRDTCGVMTDHSAWCWGLNLNGAVGNGTREAQTSPYRLAGQWRVLDTVRDGVTCGIRLNGSGWCWGRNDFGQVGHGAVSTSERAPRRLPGTWRTLHPGVTTCGVRTDDTGWCWGRNFNGAAGVGSPDERIPSPSQVTGSWVDIAGTSPTCGVQTDQTGWCWGDGLQPTGQQGDQPTTPQKLGGRWTNFETSYLASFGQTAAGGLRVWGYNIQLQTGLGPDREARFARPVPLSLTG